MRAVSERLAYIGFLLPSWFDLLHRRDRVDLVALSPLRILLSELRFLVGIESLDEKVAPEGTRSMRADGEYIKHQGKWKRVPKAKGTGTPTSFAGTARPWSTAFDDREHLKTIEAHGKAETLYRAAAKAIDAQVAALNSAPQDAKKKRQFAKLVAQRDAHTAAAKTAREAKRAANKAMEAARADHAWSRRIGHANQRDAEDNSIAFIGKSPIRGSDDTEIQGSTPVPIYTPSPEKPTFAIGTDRIDGPEPEYKPKKSLTSPGSMSVVKPRQTVLRDLNKPWRSNNRKPEPEDTGWTKALRTIELGKQHYGRQATLPAAARTIGLPARFQPGA
jgi:hypothetical protein